MDEINKQIELLIKEQKRCESLSKLYLDKISETINVCNKVQEEIKSLKQQIDKAQPEKIKEMITIFAQTQRLVGILTDKVNQIKREIKK